MRIYLLEHPEKISQTLVIHFGLGQIGTAILDRLKKSQSWSKQTSVSLSWKESDLQGFFQFFRKVMHDFAPIPIHRCLIIWSAGKTDFLSTQQDTLEELAMFQHCLRTTSVMLVEQYGMQPDLFLMGSAGGLHAGQTYVEDPLSLQIINKYGRQKLREEEFVKAAGLFNTASIFRIGSVYTDSDRHAYRGIISTLLSNGLRGQTTQLYGQPDTLRDYVFAGDLARFVVEKIFQTPTASTIHYVVSTRPTSIFELQVIAERILRRKLYITYRADGRNTTSVSFAPSIKAAGVYVSDLNTRMSVLARRLSATHVMGYA